MRKLVELMLDDLSTREVFLFRIRCEACGEAYANKPVRFSKAGLTPPTREKGILYDALYEQELRSARATAVREGAEQFNYCPVCRRLVCNRCFLICDELDMCRQCASDLHEKGTPVFSEVPEAAT